MMLTPGIEAVILGGIGIMCQSCELWFSPGFYAEF